MPRPFTARYPVASNPPPPLPYQLAAECIELDEDDIEVVALEDEDIEFIGVEEEDIEFIGAEEEVELVGAEEGLVEIVDEAEASKAGGEALELEEILLEIDTQFDDRPPTTPGGTVIARAPTRPDPDVDVEEPQTDGPRRETLVGPAPTEPSPDPVELVAAEHDGESNVDAAPVEPAQHDDLITDEEVDIDVAVFEAEAPSVEERTKAFTQTQRVAALQLDPTANVVARPHAVWTARRRSATSRYPAVN